MDGYMKEAVEEAFKGIEENNGGPFGAVIVRNNEIIARGHNEVLKTNDPTAHAEMVAIRKAAALLNRFDLSDCVLYTSCEPCPMCYAATCWAKIKTVYYGCTREDASQIGFDDELIYDLISGAQTTDQIMIQVDRDECLKPFEEWMTKTNKTIY